MPTEEFAPDTFQKRQLRIVDPNGHETRIVLDDPCADYILGRSRDCLIKLSDKSVSRHHLLFRFDENGALSVQKDERGRSAPKINDVQIAADESFDLKAGDTVSIGGTVLTLENLNILPGQKLSGVSADGDASAATMKSQSSSDTMSVTLTSAAPKVLSHEHDPLHHDNLTSEHTRYLPKSDIPPLDDDSEGPKTSFIDEDMAKAVLGEHKRKTKNQKYLILLGVLGVAFFLLYGWEPAQNKPRAWTRKGDYKLFLPVPCDSYSKGPFVVFEDTRAKVAVYQANQGCRWWNYTHALTEVGAVAREYLKGMKDVELVMEQEDWFGQSRPLVSRQSNHSVPYASIVSKFDVKSKYVAGGRMYLSGDSLLVVLVWQRNRYLDSSVAQAKLQKQLDNFMYAGSDPDGIDRRNTKDHIDSDLDALRADAARWFGLREAAPGNTWESYHRYMSLYHYISENGTGSLPVGWDVNQLWEEISSVAAYISSLVDKHRNISVAAKNSGDLSTATKHAEIMKSEILDPRDFRWISAQKIINEAQALKKSNSWR